MDAIIPSHPKDYPVLPWTIPSVRRWMRPAPGRIVLIVDQPLSAGLELTLRQAGADEILLARDLPEEELAAPPSPILVDGADRTGWYRQQILKWRYRSLSSSEDYFVIDSDTLLIAPLHIYTGTQRNFFHSHQHHIPYFETFERLLGFRPQVRESFIVDYMVFNRGILNELVRAIEQHTGRHWISALWMALPGKSVSEFSEFETYGNFATERNPDSFAHYPDKHISLGRDDFPAHWAHLARARLQGAHSMSYHSYTFSQEPRHQVCQARIGASTKSLVRWALRRLTAKENKSPSGYPGKVR